MAKALPQSAFEPEPSFGLRGIDDPQAVTLEMLIHALEHANRDVRIEAAKRLSQCRSHLVVLPLVRWLLADSVDSELLVTLVIKCILAAPEGPDKTSAILIASRHPSLTVQRLLLANFAADGNPDTKLHRV